MKSTSNTTQESIDQLIIDYLTHQLSESDIVMLSEWVERSPQNRDYFLDKSEIWFSSSIACVNGEERFDKEKAFEEFLLRVRSYRGVQRERTEQFNRGKGDRRFFFLKIAACAIALLGLAYGSFHFGQLSIEKRFSLITIEAPIGSRIQFQLPDGSSVFLNSGSKARYSQGFGVRERRLELEGEGYFDVKRDDRHPFLVNTPDFDVKVLGTQFNFTNYRESSTASVALIAGKVSLLEPNSHRELCTLTPDQSAIYDKRTKRTEVKRGSSSMSAVWTNGELFFNEEDLTSIVRRLERSYNVKIDIENEELAAMRFYGSFGRLEMSIDEILRSLSKTGKLTYSKIEDATYIIEVPQ